MKRAFTLIELLVYMAIMSFIIVVAGRVFSDSTIMRVRSQNMVKSSEEIGKLANLIREDVSQMGTKAYGEVNGNNYLVKVEDAVYIAPNTVTPDLSSYMLFKKESGDSLVFRKMAFNQNGTYAGVREITWFFLKSDGTIHRGCKTVNGTEDDECPMSATFKTVLMGSNITKLEFFPSKPGNLASNPLDILFSSNADSEFSFQGQPSNGDIVNLIVEEEESNTLSVRGFPEKNSSSSDKKHAVLCLAQAGSCIEFQFYQGETYAIEFEMPFVRGEQGDSISAQFLPGEDHLAVGLRKNDYISKPAGAPSDVLIYPPQSYENLLRHIEITPKETLSASIALTFAFYSPKAYLGRLRFKNFKVFRKSDEAFHFPKGDYGTDFPKDDDYGTEYLAEKKNAKAFEMVLEVERKGEKTGTYAKNENGMVILTPNNGISAIGSNL
jgi:type II secretory pathway pseudopilin PulG